MPFVDLPLAGCGSVGKYSRTSFPPTMCDSQHLHSPTNSASCLWHGSRGQQCRIVGQFVRGFGTKGNISMAADWHKLVKLFTAPIGWKLSAFYGSAARTGKIKLINVCYGTREVILRIWWFFLNYIYLTFIQFHNTPTKGLSWWQLWTADKPIQPPKFTYITAVLL